MVGALQSRGARTIDVGCFQVDLSYHPHAFASLEEAFDPDANARAAARILTLGRFGGMGWAGAAAAYHSATPLIGMAYLQKVQSVWSYIRLHPKCPAPERAIPDANLLSPQALSVRVVTPLDPCLSQSGEPSSPSLAGATVQWLHQPPASLPRVITGETSPAGVGIETHSR
jgi:hypothetical protein